MGSKKVLTLLFTLLLCLAGSALCDIIYTEGFETVSSLPTGWYFGSGSANWAIDSGSKAFGNYSLRLNLPSTNGSTDSSTAYSSFITVTPNQLIRVSGYVRTNGVSGSTVKYAASIELIGTHTSEILGEGFETTGNYTYLEKTVRLGGDTSSVAVYLRGYGPEGQVWFDNITVETVLLPTDLDAGLYSHWRLDGNFNDSGARGLNLTSIGTGGVPTVNNNGYTGKCYSFNNITAGSAQVLYPGAIDVKNIDGVTFTAWINPSVLLPGFTTTSPHTIARLYMSSTSDDNLEFRIRDNKLDIYYKRPVANNYTSFTVPLNQWSFVAFTQQDTSLTIYLNDQKQTFSVQAASNYNRLLIGANSSNVARGLNGLLDEVRLYNRALTDDQIRDVRGNTDINKDRIVNYNDVAIFNEDRQSYITGSFIGDINDDGLVNILDLIMIASDWLEAY